MAQSTKEIDYTNRLQKIEGAYWRKFIDVQLLWKWEFRFLKLGFVLDIGCGIGRNLRNLKGNAVGVDHNAHSLFIAKQQGLEAYTPEAFSSSEWATGKKFDALLFSHVAEHLGENESVALLKQYTPYLKENARIVMMTPQEKGFTSDATHIEFIDDIGAARILQNLGYRVVNSYSFPFPRFLGKCFKYNSFVVIGEKNLNLLT